MAISARGRNGKWVLGGNAHFPVVVAPMILYYYRWCVRCIVRGSGALRDSRGDQAPAIDPPRGVDDHRRSAWVLVTLTPRTDLGGHPRPARASPTLPSQPFSWPCWRACWWGRPSGGWPSEPRKAVKASPTPCCPRDPPRPAWSGLSPRPSSVDWAPPGLASR